MNAYHIVWVILGLFLLLCLAVGLILGAYIGVVIYVLEKERKTS